MNTSTDSSRSLIRFVKQGIANGIPAVVLFGVATGAGSLLAQQLPLPTQAAVQQLEELKLREKVRTTKALAERASAANAPEIYPGESEDLGTQRLLSEKPVVRYFEANVDTQYTYTSNANLDHTNPKDTGVWATTLSLTFSPEAIEVGPGKLNLSAGYRHLFWVYDLKKQSGPLNYGNFELSSLFMAARYSFNETWRASLGLDYNRVLTNSRSSWRLSRDLEPGSWKEAYVAWNPNWSLDKTFSLSSKVFASLSYSGGYHFTHTDPYPTSWVNDHLDNSLMGSLIYQFSEKLMLQPYARVQHSLYTRSGNVKGDEHRRDFTRSLGANVMYTFSDRWSARASISGEFRNSNDPNVTDYSKFESAIGLSAVFKF